MMDILKSELPEVFTNQMKTLYGVNLGARPFVSSAIQKLCEDNAVLKKELSRYMKMVKEMQKEIDEHKKNADNTEMVRAIKTLRSKGFRVEIKFMEK